MCRSGFPKCLSCDAKPGGLNECISRGFFVCPFHGVLRGSKFFVVCTYQAEPHRCDVGGFSSESLRQLLSVCLRQVGSGEPDSAGPDLVGCGCEAADVESSGATRDSGET